MELIGKVYKVLDLIEGESSNGQPWEKQTVVVESPNGGGKPTYTAVEFMGEKKTAITKTLSVGDLVHVRFYIVCTEYTRADETPNWFTKLDGSSITRLKAEESNEQSE